MRRLVQLFNCLYRGGVGRIVVLLLFSTRAVGSQLFQGCCAGLRGSDKSAHGYDGILENALQQAYSRVFGRVTCMKGRWGRVRYVYSFFLVASDHATLFAYFWHIFNPSSQGTVHFSHSSWLRLTTLRYSLIFGTFSTQLPTGRYTTCFFWYRDGSPLSLRVDSRQRISLLAHYPYLIRFDHATLFLPPLLFFFFFIFGTLSTTSLPRDRSVVSSDYRPILPRIHAFIRWCHRLEQHGMLTLTPHRLSSSKLSFATHVLMVPTTQIRYSSGQNKTYASAKTRTHIIPTYCF